jgi:hypothetical protein
VLQYSTTDGLLHCRTELPPASLALFLLCPQLPSAPPHTDSDSSRSKSTSSRRLFNLSTVPNDVTEDAVFLSLLPRNEAIMSTGKRLAKRSILGTKVMVPGQDGKFYPGHIQAVKSSFDETTSCRYSVRFEENRRVFEFTEKDIIGPGFSGVGSVQLLQGQVVYVTHNQREMSGKVVRHDFFAQDVLITVSTGNEVSAGIKKTNLVSC